MDEVQTQSSESNQPKVPKEPIPNTKPKNKIKLVPVLIALVLLLAASSGYFGWQSTKNSKDKKAAQSELESINKKLADSQKQLTDAKKQLDDTKKTSSSTPAKVTISAALKENIAAAISSKNTAALEGYMASSVSVVIAGTEKGGAESAAQAVADLAYLNNATSPWDFNLSAATLTSFKNGFYGNYFGDNTYAGQSANKYVVSFEVNSSGKISIIFMAVSSDLLTQ